jgi:hypothetical protein
VSVGYRLFESTRWRSLETGVPVAAKVSSQEWILGRVVREWKSPGLTLTQMKELSEVSLAMLCFSATDLINNSFCLKD